jgi:hypothetical protein
MRYLFYHPPHVVKCVLSMALEWLAKEISRQAMKEGFGRVRTYSDTLPLTPALSLEERVKLYPVFRSHCGFGLNPVSEVPCLA